MERVLEFVYPHVFGAVAVSGTALLRPRHCGAVNLYLGRICVMGHAGEASLAVRQSGESVGGGSYLVLSARGPPYYPCAVLSWLGSRRNLA